MLYSSIASSISVLNTVPLSCTDIFLNLCLYCLMSSFISVSPFSFLKIPHFSIIFSCNSRLITGTFSLPELFRIQLTCSFVALPVSLFKSENSAVFKNSAIFLPPRLPKTTRSSREFVPSLFAP